MTEKPKFTMINRSIFTLEYIHDVILTPTEDRHWPFSLYITYADRSSICLEFESEKLALEALYKIAGQLEAS